MTTASVHRIRQGADTGDTTAGWENQLGLSSALGTEASHASLSKEIRVSAF